MSPAGDGEPKLSTVRIRRYRPDEWREYRQLRLEALQDAPTAFGSTYEWSLTRKEADWRLRLAGSAVFVAELVDAGTEPVGMAGGYVERPEQDAGAELDVDAAVVGSVVELVSMWVRPSSRGLRIAVALVEAVVGWAVAG